MKIYTRTGDTGETGVLGGGRIAKTDARICAIGEIDELNAAVGLARAAHPSGPLSELLAITQRNLFDLGAELACPPDGAFELHGPNAKETVRLEKSIDEMTASLPPLTQFILPGGCEEAARLHFARSVARRAERAVLALHEAAPLRSESLTYLNRLSDWLFVAARAANAFHKIEETPWKPAD
jgi:cob(I)alamin adenosyltransferase